MVSFKYLMFIALVVYAVTADEPRASGDGKKVKKHAFIATAPPPHFSYSSKVVPVAYPYAYTGYPRFAAYNGHPHDGKYWPGKYEKINLLGSYFGYPRDADKQWPRKYEKPYLPAPKTAYPIAYRY